MCRLVSTGAVHTVVVYPRSTEDVVKIVKIATKYRMPVTPFSGGTSLEGNFRGVSFLSGALSHPLVIYVHTLFIPRYFFDAGVFTPLVPSRPRGSFMTDFWIACSRWYLRRYVQYE